MLFLWSSWKNFWFYLRHNTLKSLLQGKGNDLKGAIATTVFVKEKMISFKGLYQRKPTIKEIYERMFFGYSRLLL